MENTSAFKLDRVLYIYFQIGSGRGFEQARIGTAVPGDRTKYPKGLECFEMLFGRAKYGAEHYL